MLETLLFRRSEQNARGYSFIACIHFLHFTLIKLECFEQNVKFTEHFITG